MGNPLKWGAMGQSTLLGQGVRGVNTQTGTHGLTLVFWIVQL